MTMGQRILAARLDAGLSQRELAGEEITRNMLSGLEHDTANPSLATLRYLSQRLGKPVSYFLGEDAPRAEDSERLEEARSAYGAGEYRRCMELLAGATPGGMLEREWTFLALLARLGLAEQVIGENRLPYARELLEQPMEHPYFTAELERKRRVLLAKCGGSVDAISGDDEVLLLRAQADPADGERFLNAALDRDSPRWHALMGECLFQRGAYRDAAAHFHRAEDAADLRARLEECYRELEDYKMAYYYAKKK